MNPSIKQILQQHPLFEPLLNDCSPYLSSFRSRTFEPGEVIYRPGSELEYAYLIAEGAVQFKFLTNNGQEVFVEIVDKGFIVGELELLSGLDYQCIALSHVCSHLVLIPKAALLALIAEHADFALKFCRQLATNFYFYQIVSAERHVASLRAKLANTLVSLCLRFGQRQDNQATVKISNEKLSEMVNASRQRVNMQLQEWQEKGLLRCQYGAVTLLDIDSFITLSGLAMGAITEQDIVPYGS